MTTTTIKHSVVRGNREIACHLMADGTGCVTIRKISEKTGKAIPRAGRVTQFFDSHVKAMFAWTKAAGK